MKKARTFLILVAISIIIFTSCKKDHGDCRPSLIPCPENPKMVGMAVLFDGYQVGSYVYDITAYYINPAANGAADLKFYIGTAKFAEITKLLHADSANLASDQFTIALPQAAFTLTGVGSNVPQRCDCDSTYTSFSYRPSSTVASKNVLQK